MRKWVAYLVGLTLVAIIAAGAYRVYALNTQTACTCQEHSKSPNSDAYRHAMLRA